MSRAARTKETRSLVGVGRGLALLEEASPSPLVSECTVSCALATGGPAVLGCDLRFLGGGGKPIDGVGSLLRITGCRAGEAQAGEAGGERTRSSCSSKASKFGEMTSCARRRATPSLNGRYPAASAV